MSRRVIALTITAVALLGLTACTGSPTGTEGGASQPAVGPDGAGDGGQSTEDACALVQDTITQATEEFDVDASADPAAAVEAMKDAAQKVADVGSKITNDQVAALLPSLQTLYSDVSDVMQAMADGDVSKVGELSEIGESMQQTTEAFQKLCAP